MSWIFLVLAGLFEVGFATCLGKTKGGDQMRRPNGSGLLNVREAYPECRVFKA